MTQMIYKYTLPAGLSIDNITIPPANAWDDSPTILDCQWQDDIEKISIWCLVDVALPTLYCYFTVEGTGQNLLQTNKDYTQVKHVGTVIDKRWGFVWHVFLHGSDK